MTPLTKELETIVEALQFYATCKSENSWDEFWADVNDGGKKAQAALAQAPALLARVKELEAERDALMGKMIELKPEKKRDKLAEWQACYAALFNQLNPVMNENTALKAELATLKATQTAFVSENTMRESFTMRSRQDGVSNSRAICIGPGETGQFDDRLKAQQGAVIEALKAKKPIIPSPSEADHDYAWGYSSAIKDAIAIIRQHLPIAPAQGGAVKFLETIKSCKGMLPNQFIMAPQWVFDKVARGENLTADDLRFCFSSKWDEDAPPAQGGDE